MTDARGFNLQLDAWLKKAGEHAENNFRSLLLEIIQGTMERTPVDTGFLRSNWRLTTAAPPNVVRRAPGGSKGRRRRSATFAIQQTNTAALAVRLGNRATIYNNTEYANHVEFGTERMAPRSMLRLTVQEVRLKYGLKMGRK